MSLSDRTNKFLLLKRGFAHPLYAYSFLKENKRLKLNKKYPFKDDKNIRMLNDYNDALSYFFGLDSLKFVQEQSLLELYDLYKESIKKLESLYGTNKQLSVLSLDESILLYFSVRLLKPKIVVETGVSDGMSSLFILSALDKNGIGHLYSIDFPEVGMPGIYGKEPGWIVGKTLRNKWTLTYGKTSKVLLPLLLKVKYVNIFLHDSEHSYPNMKFEFSNVLKYMPPGSLLLSDDVRSNGAFQEACNEFGFNSNNIGLLTGKDSDLGGTIIGK